MPYQWVEPDLFMKYQGIRVYHVYKDDDLNLPLEFWYQTDTVNGQTLEFDVRDLPPIEGIDGSSWVSRGGVTCEISSGEDVHRRIVKLAIELAVGPFAGLAEREEPHDGVTGSR